MSWNAFHTPRSILRRLTVLAFVVVGVGLLATERLRAADEPTITAYSNPTAAKADPDFAVQGEYVGQIDTDRGQVDAGVQVVALGGGQFHAVMYVGGLPGDGWDGAEKREGDGVRDGDAVVFTVAKGSGRLKGGVITSYDNSGAVTGRFERVERKSPTLGRRPPEGAVVLFDGSAVDHFEGGQMSDDGLLMEGATSKQLFGDCALHLEFRTPFMPAARGQARGNSGCYLQGRYEVQILDSFGLAGLNNECGGIYEISDPAVNMCYPPLTWQTYDIRYTAARYDDAGKKTANARITVRHNGVVVQDDVEIPRSTRAAPVAEGPDDGPLYLQNHRNPMRFRNIWIVER